MTTLARSSREMVRRCFCTSWCRAARPESTGAQLHAQAFRRFLHGGAGSLIAAVAEGAARAVFPVKPSFAALTVNTTFPPGLTAFTVVAPRSAVASLPVSGPAFRVGYRPFLTAPGLAQAGPN